MHQKALRKIPRFDRKLCIACTMCVSICPVGVIELETRNSRHGFRRFPVLTYSKKCIGCGFCEEECSMGAIEMG